MPGGKAVITITPTPGEPNQFDLSAENSVPLAGASIAAVCWVVPVPGFPAYCWSGTVLHNEFDYLAPNVVEYTAQLSVTFSDGTTDTTLAKFTSPHGVPA